jgi:hypothetical protein
MKKILTLLAVLSLATACIYPYQPDLEDAPEGVLVVDGNVLVGETSTVRIGTMVSLWPDHADGSTRIPVQRVWAEDDGGNVYEGKLSSGGITTSYVPMTEYTLPTENAPADRQYRVCIQTADRRYSSDWVKPLAPPVIKNITFKYDKTSVSVLVSLEGGSDATGYILLSFDETWRFHADLYPSYEYDPATNQVSERIFTTWDRYWCWKSVNPGTLIPLDYTRMSASALKNYPLHSFSRYDNRNHRRYSIQVKARTIDKDTYKFLSHLEESTQSGDNLFTPNPGEIAGNLRCETDPEQMVMGFVTVALSSSARAWLDSRYLLTRPFNLYDLAYPKQWPARPGEPYWLDFYDMGYMPLVENHLEDGDTEKGPYGWGWASCYDCIAAGGTQDMPDFWDEL